jgi:hypothetical protein
VKFSICTFFLGSNVGLVLRHRLEARRQGEPEPEKKRQTFDKLIAEIRSLKKGAFAPLTEQPFIRAIIYPSGGLGLLAVA